MRVRSCNVCGVQNLTSRWLGVQGEAMKNTLATLVLAFSVTEAASTETFRYEPAIVRLTGTLCSSQGTDPNDESVQYPALKLKASIRVRADPTTGTDSTEENVSLLQLVLTPELMNEYARLKGQDASVTGTLMHAHTGHHHTSVLLQVQELVSEARPNKALQPTCEDTRG